MRTAKVRLMEKSVTFSDLGLSREICRELEKQRISSPFPIQEATISAMLDGQDVLGRAPTGSGKTFAFGLPILELKEQPSKHRPVTLILAPTRELVCQIVEALEPFAKVKNKKLVAIYGGVSYVPQKRKLEKGVDVIVACPGRLLDLIDQHVVKLDTLKTLVIDEADRMADMGFLPDVNTIVKLSSPDRQLVMFSATLDNDIDVLTKRYQKNPKYFEVKVEEEDISKVSHEFIATRNNTKIQALTEVVSDTDSAIIFSKTRMGADRIVSSLRLYGVDAVSIHGGKSQAQRSKALEIFTKKRADVLVATDVCARGIHVDSVGCVVNYDFPVDAKDYVHRSGRTGRAGMTGRVVSLIKNEEVRSARKVIGSLGIEFELKELDGKVLEKSAEFGEREKNRSSHSGNSSARRDRGRRDVGRGDSSRRDRYSSERNFEPDRRVSENGDRGNSKFSTVDSRGAKENPSSRFRKSAAPKTFSRNRTRGQGTRKSATG